MLAVILVIVVGVVRLIGSNANTVFSQVAAGLSKRLFCTFTTVTSLLIVPSSITTLLRKQSSGAMEKPVHERISELCAKVLAAPPSEVGPLLKELRELLHEHNQFVRTMAAKALKRLPRSRSDAA